MFLFLPFVPGSLSLGLLLDKKTTKIGTIGMLLTVACSYLVNIIESDAEQASRKRRVRLSRFFSTFSHVETLVLRGFQNQGVLGPTMSMLGNIHIDRLELTSRAYNESLQ